MLWNFTMDDSRPSPPPCVYSFDRTPPPRSGDFGGGEGPDMEPWPPGLARRAERGGSHKGGGLGRGGGRWNAKRTKMEPSGAKRFHVGSLLVPPSAGGGRLQGVAQEGIFYPREVEPPGDRRKVKSRARNGPNMSKLRLRNRPPALAPQLVAFGQTNARQAGLGSQCALCTADGRAHDRSCNAEQTVYAHNSGERGQPRRERL